MFHTSRTMSCSCTAAYGLHAVSDEVECLVSRLPTNERSTHRSISTADDHYSLAGNDNLVERAASQRAARLVTIDWGPNAGLRSEL